MVRLMRLHDMKLIKIITLSGIIAACYFAVFHLPFFFPLAKPVLVSTSYDCGFNNNVAVLSILLFVGIFGFFRLQFEKDRPPDGLELICAHRPTAVRIPLQDYVILFCFYAFVIGLLYIVVDKNVVYGEANYFVRRMERMLMGQLPYADFEYAYGVGLLYPPYLLLRMGMDLKAAYFLAYSLLSVASLYLLGYIIEKADMSVPRKRIVFYLLAIPAFPLTLGLNCMFLRFLAPYAGLLFLHGFFDGIFSARRKLVAASACGTCLLALHFCISPEIGIVFALASALDVVLLGIAEDQRYLGLLGMHALVGACFFLLVPTSAMMAVFSFASGGASWVILPAPFVIVYLVSLFLVVPAVLKDYCAHRRSPLIVAWSALSVMMVPAALGRCDPLHVFFCGFGVFLLAFAYLARYRPAFFKSYAVVFALVFNAGFIFSYVYDYRERLLYQIKVAAVSSLHDEQLAVVAGWLGKTVPDIRKRQLFWMRNFNEITAALARYGRVATPFDSHPEIYRYLLSTRQYVPDYFRGMQNCYTAPQVTKKIAELKDNDHNVLLMGVDDLDPKMRDEAEHRKWLSMLLLYPYHLKPIRDGREGMRPLYEYIRSNYREVRRINGYVILERSSATQTLNKVVVQLTPVSRNSARAGQSDRR